MDESKYRTGLKRIGAAIVDGIIFMPLLFVGPLLFSRTTNPMIIIGWIVLNSLLPLFYSVFLHYKYGQTVGKWVSRIKVIDIGESTSLSFTQAVLRDSFPLLVALGGLIYFSILTFRTGNIDPISADYDQLAEQLTFWWTIIELVTMLTNHKRRAIHDFMARSVVVRV